MILVDTSIWIDHFRRSNEILVGLLQQKRVAIHAFVLGELALGNFAQRRVTLENLARLPKLKVATVSEVARLIDSETLHGTGIGYVDVHLLASVRLSPPARLWCSDTRFAAAAARLGVAATILN